MLMMGMRPDVTIFDKDDSASCIWTIPVMKIMARNGSRRSRIRCGVARRMDGGGYIPRSGADEPSGYPRI